MGNAAAGPHCAWFVQLVRLLVWLMDGALHYRGLALAVERLLPELDAPLCRIHEAEEGVEGI